MSAEPTTAVRARKLRRELLLVGSALANLATSRSEVEVGVAGPDAGSGAGVNWSGTVFAERRRMVNRGVGDGFATLPRLGGPAGAPAEDWVLGRSAPGAAEGKPRVVRLLAAVRVAVAVSVRMAACACS